MPGQMHGSIPCGKIVQILELRERVGASKALSPDDFADATRQIHEGLRETKEDLRVLPHPDLACAGRLVAGEGQARSRTWPMSHG
jgi:hypothetical protein